jgi:transposase-like protein
MTRGDWTGLELLVEVVAGLEASIRQRIRALMETLTLHRLELGRSFKTTNCIENLNALIERRTDKVDCWRNANQKHYWLATALLDTKPRLRKVCGYRALARMRAAL